MKVLIFGSEGFIGNHLYDYLTTNNLLVTGVDLVPTHQCMKANYIEFINLKGILRDNHFDIWINASGSGDVQLSHSEPYHDFNFNTITVYQILDLLRNYSPNSLFIQISSAAVYGNPLSFPINENALIQPISAYGYHKYISEIICTEFHKLYNIKCLIIRPFSIYGIGQKKLLLWDLMRKIYSGSDTITLFGTGDETRDFLHIKDFSRLIKLLIYEYFDKQELNILNAASGIDLKIKYIVDIFKNIFPSKEFKFNGCARDGDPAKWQADITRVKQLQFKPEIQLIDGIVEFIGWYNTQQKLNI